VAPFFWLGGWAGAGPRLRGGCFVRGPAPGSSPPVSEPVVPGLGRGFGSPAQAVPSGRSGWASVSGRAWPAPGCRPSASAGAQATDGTCLGLSCFGSWPVERRAGVVGGVGRRSCPRLPRTSPGGWAPDRGDWTEARSGARRPRYPWEGRTGCEDVLVWLKVRGPRGLTAGGRGSV
jgi:hypothetical protein